jgi:hypothetical protein
MFILLKVRSNKKHLMQKEFRLTQVFTMGQTKASKTPASNAPSTTSNPRPKPRLRSAKKASDIAPGNMPDNTNLNDNFEAAPANDRAKQCSKKRGTEDREDQLPEAKRYNFSFFVHIL